MFSAAPVIFREMLEISIIIGIIAMSIKDYPKKNNVIISGIVIGVVISVIFALCLDSINDSFDGMGQEILNSSIMFIAVIMITYTIIWMRFNIEKFKSDLNDATKKNTDRAYFSLVVIIAMTIAREGAEIILFSYGILSSSSSLYEFIIGSSVGVIAAVTCIILMNLGITKISYKSLFKVITIMLILVASTMSSNIASNLNAMGLFDSLSAEVWNSSWLIEDSSAVGHVLKVFGYVSNPSALELLFYCGTASILFMLYALKTFTLKEIRIK